MKRFPFYLFIALITFVIGVSIAAFWYLHPNSTPTLEKSVLAQSPKLPKANLSAWQMLLSFENQDLKELDQKSKVELQKIIDTLVGKRKNELLIPRLISKISNAQGQINYALVEESPLLTIPGECGIRVHIFSLEGKLLNSSAFSSGWRITLTEMKLKFMPEIGREVLEVSSEPVINGRDIAKQYYALIGEKILLVRLEDSGGQLIRNNYGAPNHTIGFTLVGRPAKEWEKALESDDVAEVLATLTWLSGIHWNPQTPEPEYTHEEMREARLADDVRLREGVKVGLRRFTQSENIWVRSAANLATKVEYYR